MRLKDYQAQALDTLSTYLRTLRDGFDKRATELADIEKLPSATRERVMAGVTKKRDCRLTRSMART